MGRCSGVLCCGHSGELCVGGVPISLVELPESHQHGLAPASVAGEPNTNGPAAACWAGVSKGAPSIPSSSAIQLSGKAAE